MNGCRHTNFLLAMSGLVVFTLMACGQVYGKGSITARVDRSRVYQEQYITLLITASGSFDQIELPAMNDFDRLGTSRSTSISIINGQVSRQQQVQITLAARRTGKLTIGPIKLLKDGKVIAQSNPIQVTVLPSAHGYQPGPKAPSNPAGPSVPQPSVPQIQIPGMPQIQIPGFNIQIPQMPVPSIQAHKGKPFFIHVTAPTREVYVGEPFYVEYDLYIRADLDATDADMVHSPNFQGVVAQTLNTNQGSGTLRQVQDVQYRVYPEYRAVLTPIRAGQLQVDQMKVRLYIQRFMTARPYMVTSRAVTINVKQVPQAGRPDGYYGLVGQFRIKASLSKPRVKVGESTVLTVTISGSGSLNSVKRPMVKTDPGLRVEVLPSRDMDDVRPGLGGLAGKRVFQYLITPSSVGKYTIPALQLGMYNPLARKFEVEHSKPVTLLVTKAGGGVVARSQGNEHMVIPILSRFLPEHHKRARPLPRTAMWVLFALPLVFYLSVEARNVALSRRLRDPAAYRRAQALKKAITRLQELKKQGSADVYGEIERVIRTFMNERLGIAMNDTNGGMQKGLEDSGLDRETIRGLSEQLESISFVRFAPAAAANMSVDKVIGQVEQLLRKIDREAK